MPSLASKSSGHADDLLGIELRSLSNSFGSTVAVDGLQGTRRASAADDACQFFTRASGTAARELGGETKCRRPGLASRHGVLAANHRRERPGPVVAVLGAGAGLPAGVAGGAGDD